MADVDPVRKRLAKFVRMLGSSEIEERRVAFAALGREMRGERLSWSDIGNFVEGEGDGKYTEAEMQAFAQAIHAEAVEEGIKIGMVRASRSDKANGLLTLPAPAEMAEFCQTRQRMLKDDAQREFIEEMVMKTRNPMRYRLQPGTLGYLVSLYIKHGGKT